MWRKIKLNPFIKLYKKEDYRFKIKRTRKLTEENILDFILKKQTAFKLKHMVLGGVGIRLGYSLFKDVCVWVGWG